jgi:RND superfamily putative drug exporter
LRELGPLGRLGRWTAHHFRAVIIAWAVVALALGALAPRAEHALSGAGWEATGSESVDARQLVQREFAGNSSAGLMVVVHSRDLRAGDPRFDEAVAGAASLLRRHDAIA